MNVVRHHLNHGGLRLQPAGSSPIAALRGAFRDVLGRLSAAERVELERVALLLCIPPPRAMGANHLSEPIRLLAEVLAERVARQADDCVVRTLVGAVVGGVDVGSALGS